MAGSKLPRELQSIIDEADALTRMYGDEKLAEMNRRFDRQFEIANRKADLIETAATVAIVGIGLLLALAGLMGGQNG